jgi:hypothetical protein
VLNKCDLPPAAGFEDLPAAVKVSALRGEGIDALLRAMSGRLVPVVPPPGSAMPFDGEHEQALSRFRAQAAERAGG